MAAELKNPDLDMEDKGHRGNWGEFNNRCDSRRCGGCRGRSSGRIGPRSSARSYGGRVHFRRRAAGVLD